MLNLSCQHGFCRQKHEEERRGEEKLLRHKKLLGLLMSVCAISWNKQNILLICCMEHAQRCFQICAVLGYNGASSGNPLPTFRENISVPSSKVKKSKKRRLLDP
jgi:hypothetical protein